MGIHDSRRLGIVIKELMTNTSDEPPYLGHKRRLYLDKLTLTASPVRDGDKIVSTTYKKLIPKTMGSFTIGNVSDHTLVVHENGTRTTIFHQRAKLASIQKTNSKTSSRSPLFWPHWAQKTDSREILEEYAADRNVGRKGIKHLCDSKFDGNNTPQSKAH